MNSVIKAAAIVAAVATLVFGSPTSLRRAHPQLPYEEINAYYDGAKWVSGSTQCDGSREVTIIKPVAKSKSIHLTSFLKSAPARKSELTLRQKGEIDCAMMKCYTTYVGPVQYLIMDSNYLDEDASWIHAVQVGKGRVAQNNLAECRWFERTRVALITDLRTIYITQNTNGGFEYSTFNYQGAKKSPSLVVKNGSALVDTAKGAESFTFTNAGYTYEVDVSNSDKPFAEVLVKKAGAIVQKERVIAYTYAKKS